MTLSQFRRQADGASRSDDYRQSSRQAKGRSRAFIDAIWAPIPWILEAVFVLLLMLGDYAGMVTVAILLGLNIVCGLVWDGQGWLPREVSHTAPLASHSADLPASAFGAFSLRPPRAQGDARIEAVPSEPALSA